MSYSPTLSLYSTECFRKLEDSTESIVTRQIGPVTSQGLKELRMNQGLQISYKDYKVAVINELERKGLVGICVLMYSTMGSLRTSKGGYT